ncbi:cell division protein ZipA [Shewanella electrodiphila]|uniref:Cell division protein ZipA n=1 Tax=Shewanella electrodiphila TaxID=934143 RepID=A0ABT0KL74_9GAMM|nr:cell division protein ZipA [Shewanella electrodiphila]MCL1044336.1 cell division protein ZipA [Shewanella electrodiphila]
MEDFQLVLFVLGAIAIIAVLVHGFWSIRKQQPKTLKDNPMTGFYKDQSQQRDSQGFDADGIGEVRRVKSDDDDDTFTANDTANITPPLMQTGTSHNDVEVNEAGSKKGIGLQNQSAVNAQAPSYNPGRKEPVLKTAAVEPQISAETINVTAAQEVETHVPTQQALFAEDSFEPAQQVVGASTSTKVTTTENTVKLDLTAENYQTHDNAYVEDTYVEDTYVDETSADFGAEPQAEQVIAQPAPVEPAISQPVAETEEPLGDPQDVLVLHVIARDGEQLHGAELLPCLLSLNFKFGDMDIFHRHLDNAGNGKVLFSMANMLKPGVFDPDNMEQFVTQGVVLFMTLPCHGDPLMNFSIMLNSAQQLADDLGAEVMDDKRLAWTETNKQQYLARIRAVS